MRWSLFVLTSVWGLIFLSGMTASSTHGSEKIASEVGLLAIAVLAVRTARLGIFARPEQLVVRDYFRTYQIRWQEITSSNTQLTQWLSLGQPGASG
jgi:hypothetical protein